MQPRQRSMDLLRGSLLLVGCFFTLSTLFLWEIDSRQTRNDGTDSNRLRPPKQDSTLYHRYQLFGKTSLPSADEMLSDTEQNFMNSADIETKYGGISHMQLPSYLQDLNCSSNHRYHLPVLPWHSEYNSDTTEILSEESSTRTIELQDSNFVVSQSQEQANRVIKKQTVITAVSSFHLDDLLVFKQLIGNVTTDICIRSIYLRDYEQELEMDASSSSEGLEDIELASALEHCMLRMTQQPLRSTEGELSIFQKAVVIIRDPITSILEQFKNDYQTVLGPNLLRSDIFVNYAMAKVLLWRRHLQYWMHQKYVLRVPVHFVRLEDFVLEPTKTINELADFLSFRLHKRENNFQVDQHKQPVLPCSAKITIYSLFQSLYSTEMESAKWLTLRLRDAVEDETRPFLCRFDYAECVPDDYALKALHTLENSSDPRLWFSGEKWWMPPRSKKREIHLLTTYFEADQPERQVELDDALIQSAMTPDIDRIHIWIDDPDLRPPIHGQKLQFIYSRSQASYTDLFEYANQYLSGQIVVIQNADITWVPRSTIRFQVLHPGLIFALSRHSNLTGYRSTICETHEGHNRNLCLNYAGSHDAFAFIPPIDPMVLRQLHFKQNTWGAENLVIQELKQGGYLVENPCMDILAMHFHCSGIRRRTGHRLTGPMERRPIARHAYRAPPKPLKAICSEHWCHSLSSTNP